MHAGMGSRRRFLGSLGMAGLSVTLSPASAAEPSPKPSPAAARGGKTPSASARAIAAAMRRFDPSLSRADIETIAKGIDANADAAGALNPKKKRLPNGLGPVTTFRLPYE